MAAKADDLSGVGFDNLEGSMIASMIAAEAIRDPSKLMTVGEEVVEVFEDTPRRYRKHVEKALELHQLQLDIAETFATPSEVFSLYLHHGTP